MYPKSSEKFFDPYYPIPKYVYMTVKLQHLLLQASLCVFLNSSFHKSRLAISDSPSRRQ